MSKKSVKFTKFFGGYNIGETATFTEFRADALVKGGVAIEVPREVEKKEVPCKAKSQGKSTLSTDTPSEKS